MSNILLSLGYFIKTPFLPIKAFTQLKTSDNKKGIAIGGFLLGLIIIASCRYYPLKLGLMLPFYFARPHWLILLASFTLGLGLQLMLKSYLITLFINRLGFGQIHWTESLMIVAFSMLPFLVQILWPLFDLMTIEYGLRTSLIWHSIIASIGIHVMAQVAIWRSMLILVASYFIIQLFLVTVDPSVMILP